MLIDVGKPAELDAHCIMVLSSDDIEGWSHPLAEIYVADKRDLPARIQEVILKFRSVS